MKTYSLVTCKSPDQIPAAGPPLGFKSGTQVIASVLVSGISRGKPTINTFPGQELTTSASKDFPVRPSGSIALSAPPIRIAFPPATTIESGIDAVTALIGIKHDMGSVDCDYVSRD